MVADLPHGATCCSGSSNRPRQSRQFLQVLHSCRCPRLLILAQAAEVVLVSFALLKRSVVAATVRRIGPLSKGSNAALSLPPVFAEDVDVECWREVNIQLA
eukprot:CAMPEP_0170607520 /NCGR_PEP_ID=MMETSP0224-20130122/21098_1 /TAXON_ID=285029 /ORGANISM="Togula jolla, Strain CCCM 725" /LENGTH=100 /DNA_ID=CAMNT_0010932691 /DNA_START=189 /DNA_END=491 /DNA_ORIENTATION=-